MVLSPAREADDTSHRGFRRRLGALRAVTRIRRPSDVARLVLAGALLAALVALAALEPSALQSADGVIPTARTGLLRSALHVGNVAASLATLAVLLAAGVEALRLRPFAALSAVVAAAVGTAGGLVIALAITAAAGDAVARTLLEAGLPVTSGVALVLGADLRRRRWLVPACAALAVSVGCAVVLGSLSVPGAGYSLLVGAAAGWGVRAGLGVVPARPAEDAVLSLLRRSGWEISDLRVLEQQAGRVRYLGLRPRDVDLHVTVVDPDRRGVALPRRVWRFLRLRTAAVGRPLLSVRGNLERQALSSALADTAGVCAPRSLALLASGPALVLVEQPIVGIPLAAAAAAKTESNAAAAFAMLRRLHKAGIAHGALSADTVVLLASGEAGLADLSAAQPAASALQRELDVVALLAAVGVEVGVAEAVAGLRSSYGISSAVESRLAALLQPLALPGPVRHAAAAPLLHQLRDALTESAAGDVALARPPRLERLRPRTVLSVVGGSVAVYILAGQLSSVSIVSDFHTARRGWLVVALAGSALSYLGSALALQPFLPRSLPFGRTALVQLAASFVALVTPPAVGHLGLNIRYVQRSGASTATATATVAVKETVTVVATVIVLLVCGWLSGVSGSRLTLLPSGDVLAVLSVSAGVLAAAVALPASRHQLRRRLEPVIRRTLPQLMALASRPSRLATAMLGVLVLNGGYVLALQASLLAFSTSLSIPTLVVVYLAASTLGSAAPTPGGLGAVEATLVGGLTATGVPVAAAVTAVLAYRAATFWLPAPLGWAAFVMLQRGGRI